VKLAEKIVCSIKILSDSDSISYGNLDTHLLRYFRVPGVYNNDKPVQSSLRSVELQLGQPGPVLIIRQFLQAFSPNPSSPPERTLIIGFVDGDSKLGRFYESRKSESRFYGSAKFYSVEDL
jgi:hypothetical protein